MMRFATITTLVFFFSCAYAHTPEATSKVYFDISIGGKPAGRIVMRYAAIHSTQTIPSTI